MQLCCCTPCDARTLCGELRSLFFYCTVTSFLPVNSFPSVKSMLHTLHLLFFYCTVNSFPTVNSFLTVNSMKHTLWPSPMWQTHYMWWAPLSLFLLYCELFSNRELFTNHELCDARTLENFTMLPDVASLLHPMWHTLCLALYTPLFYCIVNSFPTVSSVTHP